MATIDVTSKAYITQQLQAYYTSLGLTPGPRGSGATDLAYYADEIAATGGWTDKTSQGGNNIGYWQDRIKSDATKQNLLGASGSAAATTGSTTPVTNPTTGRPPQPIDPRTGRPAGASTKPPTAGTVTGTTPVTPSQMYQQAYQAALMARRKAGAGGRASTILAGFTAGAPTTQPATLLGS